MKKGQIYQLQATSTKLRKEGYYVKVLFHPVTQSRKRLLPIHRGRDIIYFQNR